MVPVAADLRGHLEHRREREVVRMLRRDAQAVPRREAPCGDPARGGLLLEGLDGPPQAIPERRAIHGPELRLDVVEVVEVDRRETQVSAGCGRSGPAGKRARSSGTAARSPSLGREAGIQERLLDVAPHGPRVVRVVREVAALGRDEDLVAPRGTRGERLRQRAADGALALLAAVVDRRIEDVDARRRAPAAMHASYPASTAAPSSPRYVPRPIEDSESPIPSRKCPSAAPARCANLRVPSAVALV